jgi:TonB family protein
MSSSVVKENQVLTSIPETATTRPVAGSTATAAGDTPARPQPVALEVSVTVNGARTVAGSDKREPFSESTKTVLIFGNGAVVRLSSSVAPGQLLFLTNEKTKKEVVCQVVKSKNYHNVSGYVELEFTEPVAGFWGMRFPASGTLAQTAPVVAAAPKISAAGPSTDSKFSVSNATSRPDTKPAVSSLPRVAAPVPPAPASSTGPPSTPPHHVPVSKPQISSSPSPISLPSVPSASDGDKSSNVLEIGKVKTDAPISSSKIATVRSKSILDSDEVKIPSWLEPLARNAAAASTALPEIAATEQLKDHDVAVEVEDLSLTEVADTPEIATHALAPSTFGTHFLAEENDGLAAVTSSGSNKKILVGAIAAGLLLLVGGGAWYMHQQSANSGPVSTVATVNSGAGSSNGAQTQLPTQVSSAASSTPSGAYTAISAPASTGAGTPAALSETNSAGATNPTANLNKRIATVDAPVAVASQQKKPTLGSVNLSSPIVNRPTIGQDHAEEALNLESSSQVGLAEGLSSSLVANSKQPIAPAAPLPVGGDVKAARLISSVAPQYPTIARSQRVAGDVKIDALVDATGRVSSMKIVSGPPLLQQPAMEALRHWKYEPALLDGKAVPMHLTVTVQFKLQ